MATPDVFPVVIDSDHALQLEPVGADDYEIGQDGHHRVCMLRRIPRSTFGAKLVIFVASHITS